MLGGLVRLSTEKSKLDPEPVGEELKVRVASTLCVPDLVHEIAETRVPVLQLSVDGKVTSGGKVNSILSPELIGGFVVTATL